LVLAGVLEATVAGTAKVGMDCVGPEGAAAAGTVLVGTVDLECPTVGPSTSALGALRAVVVTVPGPLPLVALG
jgi:hypothetical protein